MEEIQSIMMLLYQVIIILLIFKLLKPKLLKAIFKNKVVEYHMIDTGDHDYAIAKNNHFKYQDREYVVNHERKKNGVLYYISTQSEPLDMEFNKNKCTMYISSDEFTTVLQNEVLSKLLVSKEVEIIKRLLIFNIVIICIVMYIAYMIHSMSVELDFFRGVINANAKNLIIP